MATEYDNVQSSPTRDVVCGLLSGLSTSMVLQPMDKALYLGMKHHRTFFHAENWFKPYHAMGQTLFYRATSHALYFPIEQWTRKYFDSNIIGGMIAGGIMSTVLNPMSVVRMQCWLSHSTFKKEVLNLWYGRGLKNFGKGLIATLWRDVVFGAAYAGSRHWDLYGYLHEDDEDEYSYSKQFLWNGTCALFATTLSSPFNYIRNIQFATPANETPLNMYRLATVIMEELQQTKGIRQKFDFLQIRFKFGWGTIRVGLGMALGSQAYEYFLRTVPSF